MYGKGISREGSLIDVGVEQNIIRKSGAWYTYDGDQLGQGKEKAREFLKENPDVAAEIEKKILEKLGVGPVPAPATRPAGSSCRRSTSDRLDRPMAGRRRGARSGRGWDAAPSRAGDATPARRRKRGGPALIDQLGEFAWPEGAEPADSAVPADGVELSGGAEPADGGGSSARGAGSSGARRGFVRARRRVAVGRPGPLRSCRFVRAARRLVAAGRRAARRGGGRPGDLPAPARRATAHAGRAGQGARQPRHLPRDGGRGARPLRRGRHDRRRRLRPGLGGQPPPGARAGAPGAGQRATAQGRRRRDGRRGARRARRLHRGGDRAGAGRPQAADARGEPDAGLPAAGGHARAQGLPAGDRDPGGQGGAGGPERGGGRVRRAGRRRRPRRGGGRPRSRRRVRHPAGPAAPTSRRSSSRSGNVDHRVEGVPQRRRHPFGACGRADHRRRARGRRRQGQGGRRGRRPRTSARRGRPRESGRRRHRGGRRAPSAGRARAFRSG